ncbi:MAG: VCBS repeat-containing protein [Alphaproteobacteria bacterium]|nr:VCBS repeat-containing protein [Alphaproteobacteria bacterium]
MPSRFVLTIALLIALPAAAGEWIPTTLGTAKGLRNLVLDLTSGAVLIETAKGYLRVVDGKRLAAAPAPDRMLPKDAIPHSRAVKGTRDIASAWLSDPTRRYGHGVLGDQIEAGSLSIRMASGTVAKIILNEDSVFEDLMPRLHDLDGDGRDEVIVVRSYLVAGAAVAVFGLDGGKIVRRAESPPIGQSHRWLCPVGMADFDGDGRIEIAVVETPHLGRTIVIYRQYGEKLVEVARQYGHSNHFIGSTVLDMSAVLDVDGDGIRDMVVPTGGRSRLVAMSFAGGKFKEIARTPHGAEIVTAVIAADLDGNGTADLVYGWRDGRVELIRR